MMKMNLERLFLVFASLTFLCSIASAESKLRGSHRNDRVASRGNHNDDDPYQLNDGQIQYLVNGNDATGGEFPFFSHMCNKDKECLCGGSLVDKEWIVTAAHCGNLTDGYIFVNTSNVATQGASFDGSIFRRCTSWFVHDGYEDDWEKNRTNVNDVALCHLNEPVEDITPIKINREYDLADVQATVVGYGSTSKDGKGYFYNFTNPLLQKAELPIVDNDDESCQEQDRPGNMCAFKPNIDVCFGDSGGPLLVRREDGDFLLGITSYLANYDQRDPDHLCGVENYGSVYTRASSVEGWITETISGNTAESPTELPSNAPTSASPSDSPTTSPTASPTTSPTASQSEYPTSFPATQKPTESPKCKDSLKKIKFKKSKRKLKYQSCKKIARKKRCGWKTANGTRARKHCPVSCKHRDCSKLDN